MSQGAAAQQQQADQALKEAQQRAHLPKNSSIDLAHGRDIVLGTAKCANRQGCVGCFQCHKVSGAGSPGLDFPRLTGQSYRYLYSALQDFASGRRPSKVMGPIAKALSPHGWRDVAAFYSLQKTHGPTDGELAEATKKVDPQELQRGALIANVGLQDRGVQGCVNCHGPQGAGLPPVYPFLAGQYQGYLQSRLEDWKKGKTTPASGAFAIMPDIAKRLTDNDIKAVSAYFAAINPPRIVREQSYAGPVDLGVPFEKPQPLRGQPISKAGK